MLKKPQPFECRFPRNAFIRNLDMAESQWLFSVDALDATPSICSREKELYDRARGVEFLFRLGASLALLVLLYRL